MNIYTRTFLYTCFLASILTGSILNASDLQQQQSTLYPFRSMMELQDDFAGGSTGSTTIGTLGWSTSGGTTTFQAPTTDRPGIIRRDTGAASGTEASLFLTGATRQYVGTLNFSWTWAFKLNQNDANTTLKAGVSVAAVGLPFVSGAYIEKLDADTNWFCVSRQGGVESRVDSTVAVSTNFVTVSASKNSSGTQFYIDNTPVCGLITANQVTSAMLPVLIIVNSAAASKTVDIDYFQQRLTGISR